MASALAHLGDARAVEPLIKAASSRWSEVRYAALGALHRLALAWRSSESDAEAPPNLLHLLARMTTAALEALRDEHDGVRRSAAEALGQRGDGRAIAALTELLKGCDVPEHDAAIDALKQLGAPNVAEVAEKTRIGALLSSLPNPADEYRVMEELGARRASEAVEPLLAMLTDVSKSGFMRGCAAKALGHIGDARAVQPLIDLITDSDRIIRCAAAEGLGLLGDLRAFAALVRAEHDGDEWVESIADSSLSEICRPYLDGSRPTGRDQLVPLLDALWSDEQRVAINAARVLGIIGGAHVASELERRRASTGDSRLRNFIGSALEKCRDA